LTYNFATAISETTIHKLQKLATELQLVSSFQNCELKQEPARWQPNHTNSSNFTIGKEWIFSTFAELG